MLKKSFAKSYFLPKITLTAHPISLKKVFCKIQSFSELDFFAHKTPTLRDINGKRHHL